MGKSTIRLNLRASFFRCLVAFWTVGIAFALTLLMSPWIEPGISPLFLLAVMISAWRGGLGAGLLSTLLSAFASAFVFLPPAFSLDIERNDLLQLIVFTFVAIAVGSLSADRKRLHRLEQKARIEAEQAIAVKDEFLAAVSHELRTPLTTIKALTRIMQRREVNQTDRQEYLQDIAAECDRQIGLVNNLLDLSRIKANPVQIDLQRVNVKEVLQNCRKIQQIEAQEHNHELSVELTGDVPFIRADYGDLRRTLCTLIENAVKYTPRGGRIALTARKDSDNAVIIEVKDNGRGIEAEDLPHVFDKFYRGRAINSLKGIKNEEPEIPGIGLGLYLARALVEGMNGSIDVISEAGQGSTFVLWLPAWSSEVGENDWAAALSSSEIIAAEPVHTNTVKKDKVND